MTQMDEGRTVFDYASVLRRRKWWLIVPIVVAVVIGALLALVLPREYSSYTTLAVSSPAVASNLIGSAAQPDLEERVRAISHELLSRTVLERVVQEEGLGGKQSVDGAIAAVRSNTSVSLPVKPIAATRSGPDTFIVTYVGSSPDEAQRVTNRLATVFLDEHSKIRAARAEGTSAFLGNQLSQSRDRLQSLEAKLRQMKESFMGRLPEQTQANLQMVAGLRQQQESTAMSLRAEQDRLSLIERQIEAMRQGAADAPAAKSNGPTARERVVTLQRQLDEATMNYTEKHPEVQRLRAELASAQAEAKAEAARPADERATALQTTPAYRQLLADRDSARLRINELQRSESHSRAEIGQYQARVEAAPMIEQQLASLNREYELERQQYTTLTERHQSALLGEDLERRGAAEQFTVLYPAFRPSTPTTPNVPRLLIMAVLAGIVLGGVLAFGREYLDSTIYDGRTLQREFAVPVLVEIPKI
jgi:polysaccharide chain length determinant protein (PEP-CTERM system associated)